MITKMITKYDDKGDDKNLKGQSKNEFKIFKIESRTLQDSRGKLISRIKDQDSRDQDSRLKIQESREGLIKISMKRIFQKLSSTWILHKTCLPKSLYSLVIDYQKVVTDYQCFKMLRFQISRVTLDPTVIM